MSEYKGIKGFQVQTRTEDPSPTEAQIGDFYYNSATGQFKTINVGGASTGSFSSGTNLPSGQDYMGTIGSNTAALAICGTSPPPSYPNQKKNIEYDGSSWTELADLNQGRIVGIFGADGTTTAAIATAGQGPTPASPLVNLDASETWNGSSWTEVNEINTARDNCTSTKSGSSTASLIYMGGTPSPHTDKTESWNGSSWTEVNVLNNSRERGSGGGTQTNAIAVDGARAPSPANPDGVKYFETWDGTSWTSGPDTNTAHMYGASWGSSTAALVVGTDPANNVVEGFNGTAWSEVAEMGTNRIVHGGGAGLSSSNNGIITGGSASGDSNAVEEWSADSFLIKSVTTS